jgi:hypothetical protein
VIKIPNASERAMLADLKAGLLAGAKVRLFKNNVLLGENTTLANLTVADFSGYAESTPIAWGNPITNTDKKAEIVGDVKTFSHSGGEAANQVYGYAVVSGSVTPTLIYAEMFDAPLTVYKDGDAIVLVPRFTFTSEE